MHVVLHIRVVRQNSFAVLPSVHPENCTLDKLFLCPLKTGPLLCRIAMHLHFPFLYARFAQQML